MHRQVRKDDLIALRQAGDNLDHIDRRVTELHLDPDGRFPVIDELE